jgi:hypothetical protein
MGLAATSFLVYGHRSTPEYAQGIYQTKMQFRGTDGADVQQHVSSSVADSYVIHHMIKPNEQMWIVDDFTAGIQAIRSQRPRKVSAMQHISTGRYRHYLEPTYNPITNNRNLITNYQECRRCLWHLKPQ